jgi:DNA-binding response OmpR family regulator
VPADTALLGEPGFAANGDGWSFDFDPWWEALMATAARQLGGSLDGWQRAFHRDGRGASALARAAATRLGEPVSTLEKRRWHLRALPGIAHWLAVRVEGGEVRLELQAGSALAEALRGLGSDGSDLVPTSFEANSAGSAMAELGLLTGTDEVLDVRHPNPRGLVEREERRITYLRGGLWVLAALVLLTTAASSRQMARARELHRLRTTFVASVSHDLRTPLASIRLMAENLSSGYAKGREERYVGSIQREVGRLGRLVDDLLDFGRIERGLLPNLQRRPMVIEEWLDGFAARERARCAAASCAFSWELEASHGLTGERMALCDGPDLVLLDLMLPGKDGFSILRTLRGDRLAVPIIVLTARGEEFDRVQGFEFGADDYVVKPFSMAELLLRVRALIARSGGGAPGVPGSTDRALFGESTVRAAVASGDAEILRQVQAGLKSVLQSSNRWDQMQRYADLMFMLPGNEPVEDVLEVALQSDAKPFTDYVDERVANRMRLRRAAAEWGQLGAMASTKEASIARLIKLLEAPNKEVRIAAIQGLGTMGAIVAVPDLVELVASEDEAVKAAALDALERLKQTKKD